MALLLQERAETRREGEREVFGDAVGLQQVPEFSGPQTTLETPNVSALLMKQGPHAVRCCQRCDWFNRFAQFPSCPFQNGSEHQSDM